jgi:hypothetical protein
MQDCAIIMKNTIEKITNKQQFLEFMQLLIDDFKNNPNEWENKTVNDYLDAIKSWTDDMDGYYVNNNLPVPTNVNWQVFANILIAAKMYE